MFSELIAIALFLLFIGAIVMPAFVNASKRKLYQEWTELWKKDVEAEKRKIAMAEISLNRGKSMKKAR